MKITKKRNKFLTILFVISIVVLFFGFLLIFPYSEPRSVVIIARLQLYMKRMGEIAEVIYQKEGSYSNFNCDYKIDYGEVGNNAMEILCNEVNNLTGKDVTIHSSKDDYCIYVYYNSKESSYGYFCMNKKQDIKLTFINPEQTGYCDGITFKCPEKKGSPSLAQKLEHMGHMSPGVFLVIIGLIGILIVFISSIVSLMSEWLKHKNLKD